LSLPSDASARKDLPVTTGVLDYFPDAIAEVARTSKAGNDQHNPGQPLHWAKEKSTDHADCIVRHLMQRGTIDTDGIRHSAKVAWRALALLQIEIEEREAELRLKPDYHDASPVEYDVVISPAVAKELNQLRPGPPPPENWLPIQE
jgi:hypothetical protein